METLLKRIDELPDDQALEAVNLLAGSALGPKPDDEVLAETAETAGRDPRDVKLALDEAAPAQAADFARVVLIAHAATGDRADVERAVDGAGRKALLLEVAVIGILGLALVQLALTRGRKSQTRVMRIEVSPTGDVAVEIREESHMYNVGEALAPLLEAVIGAADSAS